MNKVISLGKATVKRAEREGLRARLTGAVEEVVSQLRPARPLYIIEPERIAENVRAFQSMFPGTAMFAMKCNPDKTVMHTLSRAGIKAFDCASIEEIRTARKLAPKAKIYFMHPVKAREAIKEAYDVHGVRAFVLDSVEELYKIIQETSYAPDLELFVRFATLSKRKSEVLPLSKKFGATPEGAVDLLQKCRPVASRLGLAFHVGWQCMKPRRYRKAIALAAEIIAQSGVKVETLDVGGGFPSTFANLAPPARSEYLNEIVAAVKDHGLTGLDLLAEPGQTLVANAGHVVARVELRKGDTLYLNDGVFGNLHDLGRDVGIQYPVRAFRPEKEFSSELAGFKLAGPTCTTEDMMPGPYALPANIGEGDWIAFSMAGAYATTFRTDFNGFGKTDVVCLYNGGKKA